MVGEECRKLLRAWQIPVAVLVVLLWNIYMTQTVQIDEMIYRQVRLINDVSRQYQLQTVGDVLNNRSLFTEEILEEAQTYEAQPETAFALGDGTSEVSWMVFGRLCGLLIAEGMLAGGLVILYLHGLESQEHTEYQIYCTKAGRRICLIKLGVGMAAGLLIYGVLCVLSVGSFMYRWNIPVYFQAPMENPYNGYQLGERFVLYQLPVSMTVGETLAATLLLGAVLCLAQMLFTYGMLLIVRRVYGAILIQALISAADYTGFSIVLQYWNIGWIRLWRWSPMGLYSLHAQWLSDLPALSGGAWWGCMMSALCLAVAGICWILIYYKRQLRMDCT
jgi:hypothetical protein